MTDRPFDVDTLADYLGVARPGSRHRGESARSQRGVSAELEEKLGVHRQWVMRRIAAGGFTEAEADRIAIRLGEHPSYIWPNWWDLVRSEDATSAA